MSKVAVDITPLARRRTGVGNYTWNLLRHLIDADSEFVFRSFASGRSAISLDGLNGLAAHRQIPVPTRLLYAAWSVFGRPRADVLIGGAGIVHGLNYVLPPSRSARRVVTIYDLAFLKDPAWRNPKVVAPYERRLKDFAYEADAILTCSEATKADITAFLEIPCEKIWVAPGAVDDTFQPIDRGEAAAFLRREYGIDGPFILYTGAWEPRKNVPGLLRAFERVADAIPHALVLAGAADPAIQQHLLGGMSARARVHCVGYVRPHSDLAQFYSAADLFAFPSYHEGFGLPILESMACGCPVVTAKVSSLPEAAGDAARYVDPHDESSIAEGIVAVLGDTEARDRMRNKGFEQAQRFSWRDSAETTLRMYRSLI